MFENFSFENPYVLLLLLPFIVFNIYFKTQPASYYIPHFYTAMPHTHKKNYMKSILKWSLIFSSIIALSSPIILSEKKLHNSKSIDIVLALDTSGSMDTIGFNPQNYEQSRWSVVKDVVKDFIQKCKDDRIGLVVFGTTTTIASALSFAKKTQLNIVDGIEVGVVGRSTALIDGLASAVSLLKYTTNTTKIIILLSDGEDASSKIPLTIALKFAKKYNIKIYTISIDKGNSNILKLISKESATQNFYANNKEDLYEVYKTIERLERASIPDKNVKEIKYYAFYFIALSIICSFLLLLIMPTRERI